MKGLIAKPEIREEDLDGLVSLARKNKGHPIPVLIPSGGVYSVMLEVSKSEKGWVRVCIDTWNSGYDITPEGQQIFVDKERNIPDPDDRKETFCGKRVMRIDVKETGEGMVLAYMLNFLEEGKFLIQGNQ